MQKMEERWPLAQVAGGSIPVPFLVEVQMSEPSSAGWLQLTVKTESHGRKLATSRIDLRIDVHVNGKREQFRVPSKVQCK